MTAIPYETYMCSVNTARLCKREVYLKGTSKVGYKLYDAPPDAPYFIVKEKGDVEEVLD